MKPTTTDLTAAEFRDLLARGNLTTREVADGTHRNHRTILSYYYGERRVPADVAAFACGAAGVPESIATRKRFENQAARGLADHVAEIMRRSWHRDYQRQTIAIEAFCRACEPEIPACRQPDCPLRSVSPFPMAKGLRAVA